MIAQASGGELTLLEQSLVEYVGLGKQLDLAAGSETVDTAAMRSWGDSRTCRASVIREILCGLRAENPDPRGLRLRGARIAGRLDLENLTTDVRLDLADCFLEEGIVARDAQLAFISVAGCLVEHPAEPPVDAARLTCSVFTLARAIITGNAEGSAVNLRGARIGGDLDCDCAVVRNSRGPALDARGVRVDQDVNLRDGFTATGGGDGGAVNLTGARIDGCLDCSGAELCNDSGPALLADGLEIAQDVRCDRLRAGGGIVLGGHIGRILSFEGATLTKASSTGGYALLSDGLRVDGAMFCRNGFTAEGEVRLPGARIAGRFYLDGAKLSNPGGRALTASRLTVGQDLYARKRPVAGHEEPFVAEGQVMLTGAHVGGNLEFTGAQLTSASGAALYADSLKVDQAMLLDGGFTATGTGEDGAVRMPGAHIGGSFRCDEAVLHNDSGPGLRAFRMQVDGDMSLTGGFTATGSKDRGAVRLTNARIGGNLDCSGAELRNDSGPALLAYGIQVGQDIYLTGTFTAVSGGSREVVNLRMTRVGGAFDFQPGRLEHKDDPSQRLRVGGLTYTGIPGPGRKSGEHWRELLREGTPAYAAQPYQQLAAGYRALGDDRQARRTLIAQRDDQLARTGTTPAERWWGWITKVTLGYGYQPWKALLFLAAVVIASCTLAVVLGAHGALAQTDKTATPGHSCTVIQQISVGADLNLPVGTSVARADCDLTQDSASVTAAWLSAVGWFLRLLAWLFAALFIAGFTSAVRKT